MKKKVMMSTIRYNKPEENNNTMANLLGVDFGTTSLKACLFNEKGERLVTESAQYSLITDGGFIEFGAEDFFNVFQTVFDKIASSYKIDAMAIDTQGETLVVLDKNGSPLMNAIIWLDTRAEKEAKIFEKEFGLDKVYSLTGQTEVPAGYPLPKILWLKNNKPEIFNKADKFLLLEDYIIYRLTGKFTASRSLYSSSLLMNVHTGEYIDEFLSYVGITKNQLPTLLESGVCVGEYNGIKVVTSALDQIAGITGAGVIKPGIVSETTGTALAVCAVTDKFPPYFEGIKVPAHYVKKGLYCLLMWSPTAGATLEWFKKTFCENQDFAILNSLAEKVDKGCEGLICVPHLCGTVMPDNIPNAKGSFFNVELKHTKGHFIRSIMESIAYTIKEFLDYIAVDVNEVRSMGGGAKSKLWCEIKSAVLNKKIVTLQENETATLGSAIFAGVGIDVFKDINSAVSTLVKQKDCYFNEQDYSLLYNDYKLKEKKILEIYKD